MAEGRYDKSSLESILAKIFSNNRLMISVAGCDPTTEYLAKDIKAEVGDFIKRAMCLVPCSLDDLVHVFHIIDTDGAYVPIDAFIEDVNLRGMPSRRFNLKKERWRYTLENIYVPYLERGIKRNEMKSRNMSNLAGATDILGVPYTALYMSRNLEHALHGFYDTLDDTKKSDLADEFNDRYVDNIDAFRALISSDEVVHFDNTQGTYLERLKKSWDYIQQIGSLNSLQRASNINLLVEKLDEIVQNTSA